MPDPTFEDVIRKLNMIQKDMEYLKDLTQRWLSQEKRFPIIVEGIGKQGERFGEMVDILMDARVVDIPFPVQVSSEPVKTMRLTDSPDDSGSFAAPIDSGTFPPASENE